MDRSLETPNLSQSHPAARPVAESHAGLCCVAQQYSSLSHLEASNWSPIVVGDLDNTPIGDIDRLKQLASTRISTVMSYLNGVLVRADLEGRYLSNPDELHSQRVSMFPDRNLTTGARV
jgi:hypothetical protein